MTSQPPAPEIPNPYADVDFSSCSNDRERILRIAQAADGTVPPERCD